MSEAITTTIITSIVTIVVTIITVSVTIWLTFSKIREDMRIQIATLDVRLKNIEGTLNNTGKKADEVPILKERVDNHEKRIENLEKKIK